MNRTLRFPVLLALIFFGALLFYLWGAAQMPVTDPVESNYAETAKEMALSGDWLTPRGVELCGDGEGNGALRRLADAADFRKRLV